jgi:hypothetical protein
MDGEMSERLEMLVIGVSTLILASGQLPIWRQAMSWKLATVMLVMGSAMLGLAVFGPR